MRVACLRRMQRCIKFVAKNGTTCAEPVHVVVDV